MATPRTKARRYRQSRLGEDAQSFDRRYADSADATHRESSGSRGAGARGGKAGGRGAKNSKAHHGFKSKRKHMRR